MGVSRSLDEFAAKVNVYARTVSERQIEQLHRSGDFIQRNLIAASQSAAGPDRRLSRAGPATGFGTRAGYFLGFRREEPSRTVVEFRKTGPWQFVDDSVTSGPTKPHRIAPDTAGNPRPLPPATRVRPSLLFRGGGFVKYANHPGSARFPFWNRAISTGRQRVIELHRREFERAGRDVF